jgi:hypothetical protein
MNPLCTEVCHILPNCAENALFSFGTKRSQVRIVAPTLLEFWNSLCSSNLRAHPASLFDFDSVPSAEPDVPLIPSGGHALFR